jgi:hypothetical protein
MGMTVLQCLAGRLFNAVRGVKIGFAHLKVNNGDPLAFHFIGPFEDIHHYKRCHFFGAFGDQN